MFATRSPLAPAVAILLLLSTGCGATNQNEVKLGVPFHTQALDSLDCGPASVQMWAHYDRDSNIFSQEQIRNWMGGTSSGVSPEQIADAVDYFTYTNDATWDFEGYNVYRDFFARQITSIDNYTPVIAIVDFNHAVIVNGGLWHDENIDGETYYLWDYTYFHDSLRRANLKFGSEAWINHNCPPSQICSQIISQSAISAWGSNMAGVGGSVYESSGPTILNRN